MTDQVFAQRYQISEKVGGGGMAEVYRATDSVLGRTVAVKVLHAQYATDSDFVARFRQEAQAAANLNHPNIVNIYDWGEQGGTYFIAMEYVEGKDLKQVIDAQGPFSPHKTTEVSAKVASALDVAHRHEVIHRDIKPHNIILTRDNEVKVTDFGIARRGTSTMTQTGSVLGTAQYISPEQAQGRAVSPATDVYSLGCVMYEMLTGNPPFTGDNAVSVAVKQVNEAPVPPRQVNPQIPEGLEAIVLKAMAKRPEDRYRTAEEMREDIVRHEQGLPTEQLAAAAPTTVMPAVTGAPPEAPRPPKGEEKKPVWPWIALVVGIALLAGVVLWGIMALLVPKTVEVPNVVGRTATQARDLLAREELKMTTTSEYSADVEKGRVVSQDPEGGSTVKVGSAVAVVVSKGPEVVEVPSVVTMTLEDATARLEALGLVVGEVKREHSADYAEDTVMRQDPESGKKLAKGESVNLVVSRGVQDVTVPNVVGLTQTKARQVLGNAGLKMRATEKTSAEESAGVVLSQDPVANTTVPINSTIAVVVSSGPPLVKVPDVRGKSEDDATTTLENLGLTVKTEYVADPSTNVVKQSPLPERKVAKGSSVTIWVGDGSGGP